ncbi:MAG: TlpA disulfide reductase family protein [Bacteroidota bacterium]
MKAKIQSILLLAVMLSSIYCFGQTRNFYDNGRGDVIDEEAYKKKYLKASKKLSKGVFIYQRLTEKYSKNDSVVYSYEWHITNDIEKFELGTKTTNALIGKEYPIKSIATLNGKTVNIDSLKGKPTLINLWFTGCKPCIDEMPILNKMLAEHSDRFNFLAITFDSEERVRRFLEKFDFDFPQIVNSKELTSNLGFDYYPTTLLLDKSGKLAFIKGQIPYNGKKMSDGSTFIELLEELL